MFHLDDEIELSDFYFLADFLNEKRGAGAVGDVDACGAFGSSLIYKADENSHILLSISKLNIFFTFSSSCLYQIAAPNS